MIYKNDYIYTKLKMGTHIDSVEEFLDFVGANAISEEDLWAVFTDLRLKLGENFKLDNISTFVIVHFKVFIFRLSDSIETATQKKPAPWIGAGSGLF